MASYRRPKGTVVRPIPDWNVRNLYFGVIQNGTQGSISYTDGFTNKESDGTSLIIWDCTISLGRFLATTNVLGTAEWFIAQVPDPVTPNPMGCVVSTDAGIPSFCGHNYDTSNLSTPIPGYAALSGEGIWRWENNFPLAVITPGFSFLVSFVYTTATAGFSVIVEKAAFP
jgi:hypothetical protein